MCISHVVLQIRKDQCLTGSTGGIRNTKQVATAKNVVFVDRKVVLFLIFRLCALTY